MKVKHSDKYLDVAWGSGENHAAVVQAGPSDWSKGAAQLWRLVPYGGGWYRLQVEHSKKFLDVAWGSSDEHAKVVQADMSDRENGAAQLWRFIPN